MQASLSRHLTSCSRAAFQTASAAPSTVLHSRGLPRTHRVSASDTLGRSRLVQQAMLFGSQTAQDVVGDKGLTGKTYICTGGNSGIGAETVRVLAQAGAHVLLLSRQIAAGEEVAKKVQTSHCKGRVTVKQLDLADLDSVRRCSCDIAANESRIDGLILNAGVMACPLMRTKQGFELQMGTNHLGHFAFAQPIVEKMKLQEHPSRVVVLSSEAYNFGQVNLEDVGGQQSTSSSYSRWSAYGASKQANQLYTVELARRLQGSQCISLAVHPGMVLTQLGRYLVSPGSLWSYILLILVWPFSKSVPQGAATSVYAALSPGLESQSGSYFANCKRQKPREKATDPEMAQRLWKASEALTHTRYAL